MSSAALHEHVREHHKKHGAFGMELMSTELLRNYSHEIWVGVWWGLAANLALVMVVAIGIWLKQSIQMARQRRRERMAKQMTKQQPTTSPPTSQRTKQQAEPLTTVRVEQPRIMLERSVWGASSRAVAPPQVGNHKPAGQSLGAQYPSVAAARAVQQSTSRLTGQPASAPAAAVARLSSQLQPPAAQGATTKRPEPPAAAPGAASFYRGGGRSIYSAGDD